MPLMNILGIETSCDETSISIVQNGQEVLVNYIRSSMKDFGATGGVIPEQAARKQIEFMPLILKEVLATNIPFDAIAVTSEPGLQSSLLVGKTTAQMLAKLFSVPLYEIHHTQGHVSSIWLDQDIDVLYPALCLSVSGGHTELWYRTSPSVGTLVGATQDDAVGEAFDKGAALLGLSYPGGPAIARCAENGNPFAYPFPLPLKGKSGYNFSYSGLKTALRMLLEKENINVTTKANLCASYQHGLCAHLVDRLQKAAKEYAVQQIHLVGGVAANTYLRELIQQTFPQHTCVWPSKLEYCTDNAAMIASAAYFDLKIS